jgi:hypothetical protein
MEHRVQFVVQNILLEVEAVADNLTAHLTRFKVLVDLEVEEQVEQPALQQMKLNLVQQIQVVEVPEVQDHQV